MSGRISIYFILVFVLVFNSNDIRAQENAEKKEFILYPNSEIEHKTIYYTSFKIVEGGFLVFELTSNNSGDPGNFSEATSKVVFEIAPSIEHFSFNNSEILDHHGIYIQLCRCQDQGYNWIDQGQISGEKIDATSWRIEIDITAKGRATGFGYHIVEAAIFKTSNH
jgi:hypothetical protein